MKRSIAFLLAMIMVVGMIPATLLPVLAHGIGVGVNNVQNLSIDNAPNQKIPATVNVDGLINDTAWKSDEWKVADQRDGIWDTTPVAYPGFTYRYQLHMDYEFVYGVIEWDTSKASGATVENFTVWVNDGTTAEHYTTKIVLANGGNGFGVKVYKYRSAAPFETLADYPYEHAYVAESDDGENSNVKLIEFKVFLADILGKVIDEETDVSLSSFVSAKIGEQRFYHPRVDADRDNNDIDLENAWPSGAQSISQEMIYGTSAETDLTYNNAYVTDYGVNVDGVLDERAWKNFTNYGGTGHQTYQEYLKYHGATIADYDVGYSTSYVYRKAEGSESFTRWEHYHENNVDYKFDYVGGTGNIVNRYGYYPGEINSAYSHVCTSKCEEAYINNVPVKFKYSVKSDGTYIYGAMVVSLSAYNTDFYYDKTNGMDTYFKVMIACEAIPEDGNPWTKYTQLELKHNLSKDNSELYSSGDANTLTLTDNSVFKETGKSNGNSKMPSGVGAYAKRISADTMVFEFCISYDQMNKHNNLTGKSSEAKYAPYTFGVGKNLSIILSVNNMSTAYNTAGAATSNSTDVDPKAICATSAGYFSHPGYIDILGRNDTHRFNFDGTDADFSPGMANGSLDRGIFNGLLATDRFINAAYRMDEAGKKTVIQNNMPAITAITGEKLNLQTFSVVFDGDTKATEDVTWTDSAGTVITSIIAKKGMTELTATGGGKTKTIYLVVKDYCDPEYILYEANMNNSGGKTYYQNEGWDFTGTNATVGYEVLSFSNNTGTSTVFLPAWIGDFGDYRFTANVNLKSVVNNDLTRWFSLVYRCESPNNYYQMAVRAKASADNGVEFAEWNSGFKIHNGKGYSKVNSMIGTEYRITAAISGNNYAYHIADPKNYTTINDTVLTGTFDPAEKKLTKGKLGISINKGSIAVNHVKVAIPEVVRTMNSHGNGFADDPGAALFYDYDVFMDTEYLYGAAVVKRNGYKADATEKTTTFGQNEYLRIWLNNDTPQYHDHFDAVVGFELGDDYAVTLNKRPSGTTFISEGTTYTKDAVGAKGAEVFGGSKGEVTYKHTILNDGDYVGNTKVDGQMIMVEFKIPLEIIGVTEKEIKNLSTGKNDIALSYYVSLETTTNNGGMFSPIPNNYNYLASDNTPYLNEKVFSDSYKDGVGGNTVTNWVSGNVSGVNGARFIRTDARTNTVNVDGILDDVIWNDEEERISVNSYNGAWDAIPDADHIFDYQYRVYTGREYIYGMAEINATAEDGETLDFTLWVKNADSATKATNKFRIVQEGNSAVCYGLDGKKVALTYTEKRWYQDHKYVPSTEEESSYTAELTYGKVAMTSHGGKTYVEFMFSLEGLSIVTHKEGENAWAQYVSQGINYDPWVSAGPEYNETDKFYYYFDASNGKWAENKKNGFKYFVSVTKTCEKHPEGNSLYYPSVVPENNATTAGSAGDKYCHLADTLNGDRWDETASYEITPTGYFVPQTITVDGDLSDSGWEDDRWIEVREGVNGNLQNPIEDMICATEVESYKYQMRIDDEYVYLAMVIDTPASPVRYIDDNDGTVYYSAPHARLWIQSKDTDFKIELDYNNPDNSDKIKDGVYTYENADSFTHLYTLGLANDTSTGEPNTNTFELGKLEQYVPESYVTWEPDNAYHIGADKNITVNVNGDDSTIVTSGTTLRFASNNMGFVAPYGGKQRSAKDPLAVLKYKLEDGAWVTNETITGDKTVVYPTVYENQNYRDSAIYGETKVVEENSVSARHADGSSEKEYIDKDWYAKPEIKGYVYGNERGVMTSDPTGTKTNVEFRLALSEIGCEDGEDFEYFVQGGTLGRYPDSGYTLFYPPISCGYSKTTPSKADKVEGRPYWYWATTGKLVDKAEREYMQLCNNYEPVTPIGAMYHENYEAEGFDGTYLAMKFGMLYDADHLRLPRHTEDDTYKNATYWDLKEIGMLVGYSDFVKTDLSNLNNDNVDNYNIYRMESDVILNHLKDTNMADYESYVFYCIQLLWPEEVNTKLSYRGFVEYYPSEHMYYDMADKVFGTWTYSTGENEGEYLGKPLELTNDNNPQSIPDTFTYRPTFYSDVVTRSANMIKFAAKSLKEDATSLPGKIEIPVIPDSNDVKVVYVPIDNRPVNVEKVRYQAEAAGFELVLPPEEIYYSTNVDTYSEGKSDQGNPVDLYNWLKNDIYKDGNGGYKYFIISVDQMLSGGLMGSREPFYDPDDSIANKDSLKNFGGIDVYSSEKKEGEDGYVLSDMEVQIIELLKTIASDPTTHTVYFDTIKRLASSGDYFEMNYGNYGAWRVYGSFARKQLYGSELTIENIVKGYNINEDGNYIASHISNDILNYVDDNEYGRNTVDINGNNIHTIQNYENGVDYYFRDSTSFKDVNGVYRDYVKYYGVDSADYQMYMAARERKLRIADELYPTLVDNADAFYVGYDDSKPYTTMQTNDGRYIEEKLLKGADNCHIFAGADELGFMGMTEIATHLYGSVDVNVEFFGIGKDAPGDDYDTSTLYNGVMAHINGVGGTYNYNNEGEVDILILSRNDYYDNKEGYSDAEMEMLVQSAGQLIDRVDANLKAKIPTIVIDCAFEDYYLAAMMMQRYRTETHTADISGRLNELLCYSNWGTTANSLGISISNGISRYTYLKNSPRVTDKSHEGATKVTVQSWMIDYGYRGIEPIESNLKRSKPFNGNANFAKTYNNFCEITDYIMAKLNASPILVGIDEEGKTIVQSNNHKAEIGMLGWNWDRAFEGDFDINIVDATATTVDYNDRKVTNLALGKTYTYNGAIVGDKFPDLGRELTNGLSASQITDFQLDEKYAHPYFVGFDMRSGPIEGGCAYMEIIVDLEGKYNVYQANIDYFNDNSAAGVYEPSKIVMYTSSDGTTYEPQRTIKTANSDFGVNTVYMGTDGKAAEATHVKFRIYSGPDGYFWFHTSEITILGMDPSRAEYVASENLPITYQSKNDTFIGTDIGLSNERIYLTVDDGERLKWGKGNATHDIPLTAYKRYSVSDPTAQKYISGWKWEDANGNPTTSGNPWIELDISVNKPQAQYITEIAFYFPTGFEGWSVPKNIELSYKDGEGNYQDIKLKDNYLLQYIENYRNSDGEFPPEDNPVLDPAKPTHNAAAVVGFDAWRWVFVLEEPIKLEAGHNIRAKLYRKNLMAGLLTGIQVVGRSASDYVSFDGTSQPEKETLFDSSYMTGYSSAYVPSLAPFALQDMSLFSDTVITDISFPFHSLASGYTTSSTGLYMPVYVIKTDLSTKREDCTVANGKKVILDFTGELDGVQSGDWITASGLNIKVGADETLAFGDTDMVVLPMFKSGDTTHSFYGKVFGTHSTGSSTLIFKIRGYNNKTSSVPSIDDGINAISFLGDSISTYTNWSNNTNYNSTIGGNAVWYPTGLNISVEDTWWYQTTEELGYELCVNNSYSGSVVKDATTYNTRSKNLHNTSKNVSPDVVVIFMGINDCARDTAIGTFDGTGTPPANPTTFSEAYGRTIKNIKDTYKGVEIYCCTVLPDSKRPGSDNETEYNAAIKTIAANMGASVIDLYALSGITESNIETYTGDKLHPNAAGMDLITEVVVDAIRG